MHYLATAQSFSPTSKTLNPAQFSSYNQVANRQTDDPLYEERIDAPPSNEAAILKKELKETCYMQARSNFQRSYDEFLSLDPDRFSLTKAVYLSEAAFYDNPCAFTDFEKGIKKWAELVRQILKREKLSAERNI